MNTLLIVQARMTSTRLPGKVLLPVLGKPLLEYQLERLRRVKKADGIVIATTVNAADQPIVELCRRLDIPYYRGPEQDVLARYYEAAVHYGAEAVVRVTSDCPLIDPAVVDQVIGFYFSRRGEFDYVSNGLAETYPRGMDTEILATAVLAEAYREAKELPDREHVTAFVHRQPERYKLGNVAYRRNVSHYRWTVDTAEDFELISRIITALYPGCPRFSLEDCLELLARNPEWAKINEQVRQKKYGE